MAEKCPLQTSLRALSAMRGRRDGVCARLLDRAAVPAALNTFRLDAAAIERTPDDVTGVHVPAMDPCAPFGELSRDLILYRHCSGLQKTRSACRPLEDASGRKIEVASNHELDQARADCKRRGLTPCAFHSQMHEDAVLFNMFFKNHRGGVYLEMGALDGRLFSNTLFFQQTLDWSGVLIEPGISRDTLDLLEGMGHNIEATRRTLGRTNSIQLDGPWRYGYSDLRRPGGHVAR